MAVVAGARLEMVVPRCMCGRELGELLDDGRPGRGYMRVPCQKCRDLVYEFYYDKTVPRHKLLVIQTIDLSTGDILPSEAAVFLGHEIGNRSESRGGERLPTDVLTEAIRRMREHLAGRI